LGTKLISVSKVRYPGKLNGDLALARRNEQGSADASELGDMTHEDSVDKYGGAIGIYFQLDLSCDSR
jgi:hypothetical protein